MINADLAGLASVAEFHASIVSQQEAAHGEHYCAMHAAIRDLWTKSACRTYKELGVHQGGTASNAMLLQPQPERITLVDIDLTKYRTFLAPLAEEYCARVGIDLVVREVNSALPTSSDDTCDMLVIDSMHTAQHMLAELAAHGAYVHKHIVAHDTSIINGRKNDQLYRALTTWGRTNGWATSVHCTDNVGFTAISKES